LKVYLSDQFKMLYSLPFTSEIERAMPSFCEVPSQLTRVFRKSHLTVFRSSSPFPIPPPFRTDGYFQCGRSKIQILLRQSSCHDTRSGAHGGFSRGSDSHSGERRTQGTLHHPHAHPWLLLSVQRGPQATSRLHRTDCCSDRHLHDCDTGSRIGFSRRKGP
ncbi:hypothetical protein PMAYCL1PPCAC_22951, partial [Pristionchus mayeri]